MGFSEGMPETDQLPGPLSDVAFPQLTADARGGMMGSRSVHAAHGRARQQKFCTPLYSVVNRTFSGLRKSPAAQIQSLYPSGAQRSATPTR